MTHKIRIIVEVVNEKNEIVKHQEVQTKLIHKPSNLLELGYRHNEQIELLQRLQDALLKEQSIYLQEETSGCPKCGSNLVKKGRSYSDFSAVFTDHKVGIQRLYCSQCHWKSIPSVLSLFGTIIHPDLSKLQCEQAINQTYRATGESINQLCHQTRKINNHDRIKHTCELVGNHIAAHPLPSGQSSTESKALYVQVDGGHVKSKNPDERSFEVLTSVIFSSENIDYSYGYEEMEDETFTIKYKRGKLHSKHCAASALSDNHQSINSLTLEAGKRQGLTANTHVTAICDGAVNCWQVIDAIAPHCHTVIRILDWFHIAMKFKNLSIADMNLKEKAVNAKWFLWRGDADKAIDRLESICTDISDKKEQKKIRALINYIANNRAEIINYQARQEKGLCFTSQLAESNVESLINQRCKGQQHMRWSREGLHPLLQIRAAVASNDWKYHWEKAVCDATLKHANQS